MNINRPDHLNLTSELQFAEVDLFLSLAVIAGVVTLYMIYLMFRPLLEEGEISADEWTRLEDDSLALLRQRDRVIAELKEIEFEAAMNKIDAHDLSQLRGQYQREALRLIEELERQNSDYSEQFSTRTSSTQSESPTSATSESTSTASEDQETSTSSSQEPHA